MSSLAAAISLLALRYFSLSPDVWVPNLIVAELYIVVRRLPSRTVAE